MTSEAPGKAIVDLDAERTVLGAILVDPQAWNVASAMLEPQDYADAKHRLIHTSMARVWALTQTIDHVQVKNDLQSVGRLEAAGGLLYLAGLLDGLPRITNVEQWCRLIRDLRIKRTYIAQMDRLKTNILSGVGVNEIHEEVSSLSKNCLGLSTSGGLPDTTAVFREAMKDLDEEIAGVETGVPPGLRILARNLRGSGWQRSQVVYIGGRPSRGKTALLLNCAAGAARAGKNVLFFSLEMPPRQLAGRQLLAEAGINMRELRRAGELGGEEAQSKAADRLARAYGRLSPVISRVTFSDNKPRTAAMMLSDALRIRQQEPLDLVVVDYLGYVASGARRRSLYEETTEKSKAIKDMAAILDVPVICGVQLHRNSSEGREKRPSLGSFRDSGNVEQDADVAILIHQESDQDALQTGEVELIIAKQRNGWTGMKKAWFDAPGASFYDLEEGYERAGG